MNTPGDSAGWDVEIRPRLLPRLAWAAATLIVAVHVGVAMILTVRPSGVIFRPVDRFAFIGLGLIFGAVALLLTRPRLRVGPAGAAVRNLFGDRMIPWPDIVGVSFPEEKQWARIELLADEYAVVMAIHRADKERAVTAMTTLRELVQRYRAQRQSPESNR